MNGRVFATAGLLMVMLCLEAGCAAGVSTRVQGPTQPSPALASTNHSYLFADATSVAFLSWTETGTGALAGSTEELQDLSVGSPDFLSSTTGWTGTRTGNHLMILLPGATVIATLEGANLIRELTDPGSGQIIDQVWVPGTRDEYNALAEAFRAYTAIGQDIAGIDFEIQAAEEFPSPERTALVQSNLTDLQKQLATLRSPGVPHISGLRTPWAIPPATTASAIAAAQQFLGTPTTPGSSPGSSS